MQISKVSGTDIPAGGGNLRLQSVDSMEGGEELNQSVATPLKWHGGKAPLASRIRNLFPDGRGESWLHYVEPFAGGLSVLLADPDGGEGISEVVNDLNTELTNFWLTLSRWTKFLQFRQIAEATPFSETEWSKAGTRLNQCEMSSFAPGKDDDQIERAVAFFVRCRQSLAGRMKAFSPVSRTRTRRGMNEQVSGWLTAIEGLPAVHERLKRVLILNRPALDVIRQQDGEKTVFYCDPPYQHETRATTGDYSHEMNDADHRELLETLAGIKGRFLLSGYRSSLYDSFASKYAWQRHEFEVANHAAGGETKRKMTECVWTSYRC